MLKVTIKTYALEFCSKYLPDILPPSAINLDFNNDKWEIGSEAIPVMDRTGTTAVRHLISRLISCFR